MQGKHRKRRVRISARNNPRDIVLGSSHFPWAGAACAASSGSLCCLESPARLHGGFFCCFFSDLFYGLSCSRFYRLFSNFLHHCFSALLRSLFCGFLCRFLGNFLHRQRRCHKSPCVFECVEKESGYLSASSLSTRLQMGCSGICSRCEFALLGIFGDRYQFSLILSQPLVCFINISKVLKIVVSCSSKNLDKVIAMLGTFG